MPSSILFLGLVKGFVVVVVVMALAMLILKISLILSLASKETDIFKK